MKTLLIAAAGLLLALPVTAQTPPAAAPPAAITADAAWAGITADALRGKPVTGLDDRKIGDVSDVVMGADAAVSQIVVDVGGFLGVGAKPVALERSQVTVVRDAQGDGFKLQVAATADELKALPEYKN